MNRTTGIKVREEGGVGSDFDLSINGLSGNSVRYFLDGMPLDTKGSGVSLANLPINIIDRIEIYKGVVPASLGTDALGGTINIITKQEKKDQKTNQMNLCILWIQTEINCTMSNTLTIGKPSQKMI